MTELPQTDTLETLDADALAGVSGGFVDRCVQELPADGGRQNALLRWGQQVICRLSQPRGAFF